MIDARVLASRFRERYSSEPRIFAAPGRVNLIGEHTDYNEGFVLPIAIGERTYTACSPRDDRRIRTYTDTLDAEHEFELNAAGNASGWAKYVQGMATELYREGLLDAGADLLVDSDIPFGAGLSSSAAFEMSAGLALWTLGGAELDRERLAFIGQKVEHEYVGVQSGIMDQFASVFGREEHAMLIDCRSLEITHVKLNLGSIVPVVCDSKVKHELASGEYNQRRTECEEGLAIIRERHPDVGSLRDVSLRQLEAVGLPDTLFRRCHHVITENKRTVVAVSALTTSDVGRFGELMYESHRSLRDDYEVSCAELDHLVRVAAELPGVIGARMTGGGFGGSTINLVDEEEIGLFEDQITSSFAEEFGYEPTVRRVAASDGAREILI